MRFWYLALTDDDAMTPRNGVGPLNDFCACLLKYTRFTYESMRANFELYTFKHTSFMCRLRAATFALGSRSQHKINTRESINTHKQKRCTLHAK